MLKRMVGIMLLILVSFNISFLYAGQKENDDLIVAAKAGDTAQVKELLGKGAKVNAKDNDGWTALMFAAGEGHKDVAPGKLYTIGFAIHAGHTNKRFHYVSLEKTFTVDAGDADFVAKKAP